jgi:hypothetical protein
MLLNINQTQPPIVEPVTLTQLKQQCVLDPGFTDDDPLLTAYGVAAREFCEKYTRRAFFNQSWQLTLDHFPAYFYNGTINPAIRRDWAYYAGIWNGMTIALPKHTCITVDSLAYIDQAGNPRTLDPSTYNVDKNSKPARIVPCPGLYWPLDTLYIPGSVTVDYTSGSYVQSFTEPFTVPATGPYTPKQSPVTAVTSVNDANNTPAAYTFTDGALTFDASLAGQTLTLSYYAGTTFPQSITVTILLLVAHWYQNRESTSVVDMKEIPFGVAALLDMHKVTVLDYEAMV